MLNPSGKSRQGRKGLTTIHFRRIKHRPPTTKRTRTKPHPPSKRHVNIPREGAKPTRKATPTTSSSANTTNLANLATAKAPPSQMGGPATSPLLPHQTLHIHTELLAIRSSNNHPARDSNGAAQGARSSRSGGCTIDSRPTISGPSWPHGTVRFGRSFKS